MTEPEEATGVAEPEAMPPTRRPDRGRGLLGLAVVILLVVDVAVAVNRHGTSKTVSAGDLVSLLDRGQEQTYDARYTAAAPAGHLDIELWREPPRFRQRIDANAAGLSARTDTLLTGSQAVACSQLANGPWMCSRGPQSDVPNPDAVANATRGLSGQHVTKKTTKIDGQKAVCYTLTTAGASPSVVCTTPDGIPLRVSAAGFRFEIVSLQRIVNPADFTSPG